jgi:UDP-N-acetyl-D-mannosaminuronic acid dehydrogenase
MPYRRRKGLWKDKSSITITVIGMGYIGLPTATLFASAGYRVNGFDINENTIEKLKSGKITIVEPQLQDLFSLVLKEGKLRPTDQMKPSDLFIICVPTPYIEKNDKKVADLTYIQNAAKNLAPYLQKGNIVVLESTVPPGTTYEIMVPILEEGSGLICDKDFYVAHCPERVLPGNILHELRNNDRIIGVQDEETGNILKSLYSSIVTDGNIYITDDKTAELCKLVENTYRDVNIAFANELSMICDDLNINVWELIDLANKHPRVNIMKPGPGVGGHCIAVDPWFIVERVPEQSNVIRTCRQTNEQKTQWVIQKIEQKISEEFEEKKEITIGILGLAYKPDIDDLRESPALNIASTLAQKGYEVVACEPYIPLDTDIEGIELVEFSDLIEKADILVYAVAHSMFKQASGLIDSKPVFDAVGVLKG